MTATVMGDTVSGGLQINFNQSVGDSMESALKEVIKFHQLRHSVDESRKEIEISFEEQYSSKDGPSAAVACALLAESIVTGTELDRTFAVTGDLNADGAVQPVGGIDGKIRGAINANCSIIALPKESSNVLSDYAVLGQLKPFIDIQVFSITTFDEALQLSKASEQRSEETQLSIDTFSKVQEVLQKPGGEKWLSNPHVHDKLRIVLKNTPNHESAKYLLLKGLGRSPESLSLSGSFLQIYRATTPLRGALESGEIPEDTGDLSQSMFNLRRIRAKLDPRTRACADALEDFSGSLKKVGDTNLFAANSRIPKIVEELESSWSDVLREYKKIRNDPEIQEELAL
ncbi:MAG: hypothetical protein P1U58_19220 [Verrucomicrobiales bacterium]|nr:hypothetical protein [Verrucomicrobiales bacterium]